MPKALVAFFSQGGTTAKTAEGIAKGLRTNGFQVDFNDIKAGKPLDLRPYDLLGIGSPVYACRIPFNVSDYIQSLPSLIRTGVLEWGQDGRHSRQGKTRRIIRFQPRPPRRE